MLKRMINAFVLAGFIIIFQTSCAGVNAGFGDSLGPDENVYRAKINLKGLKFGKGCKGDLTNDCGDACVEGFARGCADEGCRIATIYLMADFFSDQGWRYTRFPYEDPDGFYVRSDSGKEASFHTRFGYIAAVHASDRPSLYGANWSAALWMPSGYVASVSYIYAEEEKPITYSEHGYWHYNFFRFSVGHHLIRDANSWATLGMFFCLLDAEIGEDPYAYDEDADSIGIGAELSAGVFFRRPLCAYVTAAPATTTEGSLFDVDAGIGAFSGPLQFYFGFHGLFWQGGHIAGPSMGLGIWF